MLPPGHYGRAGRERPAPGPPGPPLEPFSWRWFFPRSRSRTRWFVGAATILALCVAATGSAGFAAWVGSYGALLLTFGVATRRMPLMGIYRKAAKTDPLGAARAQADRSSVYAKAGVLIAGGALGGLAVLGVARLL